MRGVSRLQVHGICGRRLVFREVVEAGSNYTTAWDDSSGSNRIEKDQIRVLPGLYVCGEGAGLWSVDPIL